MADGHPLTHELTSLLGALPRAQLVEITRRAAFGAFQAACRGHLGATSLDSLLTSLFPDFSSAQIADAAREIALCAVRNTSWNQLLSLPGKWEIRMRCLNEAVAERLRKRNGPAIVAFWHHGPPAMVPMGLQSIRVPALIMGTRQASEWFRRNLSREMKIVVSGGPRESALALKHALDHLRTGGVVALAVDGGDGQKDQVLPFLGRKIAVTRGIAVLARLTGAPIHPVLATWGNLEWNVDLHLFDALPLPPVVAMNPQTWDREVQAAAVRQFEAIVRSHPGQFRLEILADLARAPAVDAGQCLPSGSPQG